MKDTSRALLEELGLLVVLELGSVEYVEGSDEKFLFHLSCPVASYNKRPGLWSWFLLH